MFNSKKKVLGLVFILLLILIGLCLSTRSNRLERSAIGTTNELATLIGNLKNYDGGYLELQDNFGVDLYTTYYSYSILDTIDKNFVSSDIKNSIQYFSSNYKEHVIKKGVYENLSNLYFFTKMCESSKFKLENKDLLKDISLYISSLQLDDGSYVFSLENKEDRYFSSYLSVYILNYFGEKVYNKEKLINFVKSSLDKEMVLLKNTTEDVNRYGNINNLLQLCELLNIDYDIYRDKVIGSLNNNKNFIISQIKNNLVDLIYINTVNDLTELVNYTSYFNEKILIDYLGKVYDADTGLFYIGSPKDVNILPTAIALKLSKNLKQDNKLYVDKDKTVSTIQSHYIKGKGYSLILKEESEIMTTYFASDILKNLGKETSVDSYIENINKDEILSKDRDLYYYIMLKQNFSNKKLNVEDKNKIVSVLLSKINNRNWQDGLLDMYYNLKSLDELKYDVNEDINIKLKLDYMNNNSLFNKDNYSYILLEVMQLKFNKKEISSCNTILKYINELDESNFNLYIINIIIDNIKDFKEAKNIIKISNIKSKLIHVFDKEIKNRNSLWSIRCTIDTLITMEKYFN